MFKINYDKKITMVQGDTGVIRMRIHNYELSQGDEVRFAIVNKSNPSILLCQHSDKKIVLEKQVTVFEEDGSARIVIFPCDTEYLQPGEYLYEIQVKTKDGRIDTVVPLTRFTLMVGSIQGEYGQTTPSKPEPTPSEIELRFKRLENQIIPELGNRITNVENEFSKSRNISSVYLLNTFTHEDCILITTNEGRTILIDCGEETSQNGIIKNIDSLGIEKLDYFIITHFHSDHAGNASAIIDKYDPTNIYYKEVVWDDLPDIENEWKTKEYFDKFITSCQRNNISPNKVTADTAIPISKKETVKILNTSFINYDDYNSASLMVQYNNGKTYCLFAGDVTTEVLEMYKNSIPTLSLYKCAHHGGYSSNVSESFMLQTKPKISHINGENMDYSRKTSELAKWSCNSDVYVCDEYDGGTFGYIITDMGVYPSHNLKKVRFNEYIFEYKNNWYACNSVGDLVKDGIVSFEGNLCFIVNWKMIITPGWVEYMSPTGYIQHYYIDGKSGYLLCDCWKQSENVATPNYWYYLGSDGRMLRNTSRVIGTKKFTFDSNGVASPSPIQ